MMDEEHAAALARYEQTFALQAVGPDDAVLCSLLEILGDRSHRYETERYAIPEAAPREVLAYLMESRGLNQSDLACGAHIDQSTLSKLVMDVRGFSKAQAQTLSTFFQVPVDLFI